MTDAVVPQVRQGVEKENLGGSVLPRWRIAAAEPEGPGDGSGDMVHLGLHGELWGEGGEKDGANEARRLL